MFFHAICHELAHVFMTYLNKGLGNTGFRVRRHYQSRPRSLIASHPDQVVGKALRKSAEFQLKCGWVSCAAFGMERLAVEVMW
jgi:hypothetical protein